MYKKYTSYTKDEGEDNMFGLKFLSELYNISYSNIADACELSKAGVQRWMEKERVPKVKHVQILSNLFGVNDEYINKQLTVIEQEGLRKDKLLKETVNVSNLFTYEYTTKIDGEEVILQDTVLDEDDRKAIELSSYEASLIKTIEYLMTNVRKNEVTNGGKEKEVARAKATLQWIIELADVIKSNWKDEAVVNLVLTAVHQQITGERSPLYEDKELQLITKVMDAIEEYTNN